MTDREAMQIRMAHLERTLADVSDVVARQDREIAQLTRRVALLLEREAEREAAGGGAVTLSDPPPPHY